MIDSVDTDEGGIELEDRDSDMDDAPDRVDLDSDNDTVSDLVEGGSMGTDANDDGLVDGPDSDGDGIADSVDGDPGAFGDADDPGATDSDNDMIPDYRDPVNNDTGINDIDAAGNGDLDANDDGIIDDPTDSDGDGIADDIDQEDGFGGISDPIE